MKITVDKDTCIGCGLCVSIAPDTFELDEDGKSQVKDKNGDSPEQVKKAESSCPVEAIKVNK